MSILTGSGTWNKIINNYVIFYSLFKNSGELTVRTVTLRIMSFHATNRLLTYIFGSRIFRYPSIRLAIDLAENDESWVLKLRRQHVTLNVTISCDDVVWKNFETLDRKTRFIRTKNYRKKSLWMHAMNTALICPFGGNT